MIAIIGIATLIFTNSCTKTETKVDSPSISSNSGYNNSMNIDEKITFYYNAINKKGQKNVFGNIWKWMVAHSGTHLFLNCQGTMACGPCAGFCLYASKSSDLFKPVIESYEISSIEYAQGLRLLQIALLNDTILGISFVHEGFAYQDSLTVPENFEIGIGASTLFNKQSIIVQRGVYPVSFTHSKNGTTIVNVVSH